MKVRRHASSLAAVCLLAGCTYSATEVVVVLDTDAPADRALHLTIHVSVGGDAGSVSPTRQWVVGGGAAGAIALPASFAVVPAAGAPRDQVFTVQIDAHLDDAGPGRPGVDFRRIARLPFTPRASTRLPMFLAIECGNAASGCTRVPAAQCTVSARCEEQGLTCGARGECVAVTPPPAGSDAGTATDAAEGGDAAPPPGPCSPVTIDRGFVPSRTLFVAPTGDDSADGLAPARAWRSLANASALMPGDRVEVAAGTYPCGAVITAHGTAEHPVQIRSTDGPGAARFDCGGGGGPGLAITSAHYVALDGFEVTNATMPLVFITSGGAPYADRADHLLVTRSHLHGVTGTSAVWIKVASNVDLIANEIDHADTGLVASSADALRVVGNALHDLPNVAIKVGDGTTGPLLDGNTIWAVTDGIWYGFGSTPESFIDPTIMFDVQGGTISNNVLSGAMAAGVSLRGCVGCTLAGNSFAIMPTQAVVRLLEGGTGSGARSETAGLVYVDNLAELLPGTVAHTLIDTDTAMPATIAHDLWFSTDAAIATYNTNGYVIATSDSVLDRDPLLASPADHDLHLGAGSPALGAGVAVAGVTRDATGACRTVWDIGAY